MSKEPKPESKSAVPSAASSDQPLRLIAFGDSLTAGKDLSDPDNEAWPALLEKQLREKGRNVSVVNAGQSGDTTFDALNRLDFTLSQGGDIVLVAFGSNDTFQGKKLKDIERNLEEILLRIKAKGMTPMLCAMRTFPNFGPDYSNGYEKIFPRVAARQNVPLVPFFLDGVAGVPALNMSDTIHPNARGHERIARNVVPFVEQALKKRI
jgi:acyl-CoA thioesterase I